jgi:molecular chaperone DnaK (HSP70)
MDDAEVDAFRGLITASLPPEMEGAEVTFLTEPMAIAVSYGITPEDGHVCIIDIGAGTTDAVVAFVTSYGELTTVAHMDGDACTGNKLTKSLLEFLNKKFYTHTQTITFAMAEELKLRAFKITDGNICFLGAMKKLRRKDLSIGAYITADEFNAIVVREIKALKIFLTDLRDLCPFMNLVILSGGPTLAPTLDQDVRAILKIDVRSSPDRLRSVARGACMAATVRITDNIIPFDIGYMYVDNDHYFLRRIVPANSRLPFTSDSEKVLANTEGVFELQYGSFRSTKPGVDVEFDLARHGTLKLKRVSLGDSVNCEHFDIVVAVDAKKRVTVSMMKPHTGETREETVQLDCRYERQQQDYCIFF